ncbi:MAG: APC family permease [Erysipelotrichaceae bacterium]
MERKKINLFSMTLFTVCGILVLDTFVAPAIIGVSSITLWILTAVFFFVPYGFVIAELGATYPDNGGIYAWIKRAFGDMVATLNGWFYWVNVAFWMPAVFIAFASWFALAYIPDLSAWGQAGIAVAMCWLIVLIGIRGVELSIKLTNVAAIMKVAVLLIFGVLGIIYGMQNGFANSFTLQDFIPTFDNALMFAPAIVYNFLGFELISSIANELEDPKRDIPKMAILAGIIITFLYVFGTFGVLAALPAQEIESATGFFYALQNLCSVFGGAQDIVFKILIGVALFTLVSNMISWTLGAVETLDAAELEKKSKLLSHKHSKYGTADYSYIVMGVLATLLIVFNFALSGDANEVFWTILSFSFVIFLIPYAFVFPAAWKLRMQNGDGQQPYKVPGGKAGLAISCILGTLFVIASIVLLFWTPWDPVYHGTLIIGTILTVIAGFALHFNGRRMKD